jgi:transcriptional activator of cad operon
VLPRLELMQPVNDPVLIGDWLIDPRDDSVARGGERVKLEPRTMRLLMRLAQTPGEVVSQDELLESVWTGVVVGTASVYQSMSQLRKVLRDTDDPPRYIETVARKGYRLVATVSAPPKRTTQVVKDGAASEQAIASSNEAAADVPRPRRWTWIALAASSAIAVMAVVWQFAPRVLPLAEAATVVVLPFIDLTDGKTEQVFCDGLTEETSNWLAQIPTLRVVARTSAFAYRDRRKDVRVIGRELQTTHVVEGSLRRSGNRVRITVQLIDSRSGFQLWSKSYDEEAGDVLHVQEDIARKVADNFEIRITADTDRRFADRSSRNAEAQRLYTLAKAHAARQEGASNEKAIELYRQALQLDSGFTLAKVWLAGAISNRRYFTNQNIEQLMPEIEPLLASAEGASTQLVDFYVVRGGIRNELRQRDAAIADLQRAMALNPNSIDAASALGFYYLTLAEPRDALTFYAIASALDPRDYMLHSSRCMALSHLGQFVAAESACARARALNPDSAWVYSVTSQLETLRGNLAAAWKWSDAALAHGGDISENFGDRASVLHYLELLAEGGALYRRATATNAEAARGNLSLTIVGTAAAIEAGGLASLRTFIAENELDASANPQVLLALATAALTAGDAPLAKSYTDRALASKTLQAEDLASPWHALYGYSDLLVIAAVFRATGDSAGADKRLDELTRLVERVIESGARTWGIFELQAQVAAMRGQGDAAMVALKRAAQLGWHGTWSAEHQPYLAALRSRVDYRDLIAAVRARNAATAAAIKASPQN